MSEKEEQLFQAPESSITSTEETCHLCLGKKTERISLLPEDEDMKRKIDKIFYFQIFRNRNALCFICNSCREVVTEFYSFAEQVLKNQQLIQSVLNTPGSSASQDTVHKRIKEESTDVQDDKGWVNTEAFVETMLEEEPCEEDTIALNAKEDQYDDRASNDSDDSTDHDIDDNEYVPDEEVEIAKPKRKYAPKKNPTAKPPKLVKAEQKPREMPDSPLVEEILKHFKLSCDMCLSPLANFTDLRKHYKSVHNEPGYLKCCNKKIYQRGPMIEHIQLHLNPDSFHCDICNKSYSSKRVLREHTKEVHSPSENRPFKCETCLKTFVTFAHVNAHMMVAHGSVPCPQCPKILASQGSLRKHLVAMHGDGEQHVCDVCAKVYRSKQCFDKHVQGHLGTRLESRVQCSTCLVWFVDKNCLTRHIRRIHLEPDGLLSCELCGKQVRNQEALNCHMRRTHTESRFECSICLKKFKRPHHMREHVAIHHTGEDLYGCKYCTERFNTKNKQYIHRKTAHPFEFEEEMRRRITKDL